MANDKSVLLHWRPSPNVLVIVSILTMLSTNGDLWGQPAPPQAVVVHSYDSHFELRWSGSDGERVAVYRATPGTAFQRIGQVPATDSLFIDFVGPDNDTMYQYFLTSRSVTNQESAPTDTLSAQTTPFNDSAFLDMVQAYTFRYFWDFAHPVSGLIRERNTSGDLVTMGGSGFGVMAILVGIERGYITREQGLQRLLTMVTFLERADRFYGMFPHWMNGRTGETIPFSAFDDGGDVVETAFLLQGLLTVRAYFGGNHPNEVVLRQKITNIWEATNWNWYRQQDESIIYWHWSPNFGFRINLPIRGFNEAQIIYILAAASPTHPAPVRTYHEGWAGNNYSNDRTYFGTRLPLGPRRGGPLFFVHYSNLGLDPRGLQDDYANYFEQGVAQTLINRAWCITNPGDYTGYGPNCWGLTASDDPIQGYLAHEPDQSRDNGTITPTAALSSMPYTPEESLAALKHMYRTYGQKLWGPMGFYDAFNPTLDWTADSYLAIDQGPIVGMIENYRTQLLWRYFMQDEDVQRGLDRLGFVRDTLATAIPTIPASKAGLQLWPNPSMGQVHLEAHLEQQSNIHLQLFDAQGRSVWSPQETFAFPAGKHVQSLNLPTSLPKGPYFLMVKCTRFRAVLPLQVMP